MAEGEVSQSLAKYLVGLAVLEGASEGFQNRMDKTGDTPSGVVGEVTKVAEIERMSSEVVRLSGLDSAEVRRIIGQAFDTAVANVSKDDPTK